MPKCGVPKCKHASKRNGVCGVHRKWAFRIEPDQEQILAIAQRLEDAVKKYHTEASRLEALGHDVLEAQNYLNPNLTIPEHVAPSIFSEMIARLAKVKAVTLELQTFEPYLGNNIRVRENHRYSPKPCTCHVCLLGH